MPVMGLPLAKAFRLRGGAAIGLWWRHGLDLRWAAGQLSTWIEVPDRHGCKIEARLQREPPSVSAGQPWAGNLADGTGIPYRNSGLLK